jgi:hypothetical protein
MLTKKHKNIRKNISSKRFKTKRTSSKKYR